MLAAFFLENKDLLIIIVNFAAEISTHGSRKAFRKLECCTISTSATPPKVILFRTFAFCTIYSLPFTLLPDVNGAVFQDM